MSVRVALQHHSWSFRILHSLILIALLAVVGAGQVETVDISVTIEPESVTVEARLRTEDGRAPSATILLTAPTAVDLRVPAGGNALPGRLHIADASRIRYVVRGGATRIPLPVPDAPVDPEHGPVRLRVSGVSADIDLRDAFPRLRRSGDAAHATLRAVPSFLRIPARGARWSARRVSQWLVILFVVAASGTWIARQARGVSAGR